MGVLLAAFAHPDDETFICGGALARAAAEGHTVVLVCATRGEMGRRLGVPPTATRETLAGLREAELRAACAALGVRALRLLGYRDKTLEIQPQEALADAVLAQLEVFSPDVVLTFDERLGGHPDHCAIGAATRRAFAAYRELRPDGGARLCAVAWAGMAERPRQYGLAAGQVAAVDVSAHLPAKLAAFRAHRTQSQMNARLWGDDDESMRQLAATEYCIQYQQPYRRGDSALSPAP